MTGFPWAEIMAQGLGRMGLAPRDFWSATLREIAAAFPPAGRTSMPRPVFQQLLDQFPDRT